MTSKEIRQKYFDFFKEKGHEIIPSASLIPSETDPSVLFTTAGMQPLVPFLLGEKHPKGTRLANSQKCVRTDDIEEVGDFTHHTFFEMLGNWSLGDYFKKESLEWSLEFLTSPKWLGLEKDRIAVSVFKGDDDAPFDEEAFNIWLELGIPEKRIAKLGKKENWWGPAGQTGPCGPDSEIFYWTGDPNETPESFNDDHSLWVEMWNNVFMQYNKNEDGEYEPLEQKNIDTGMGLERTTAIMNDLKDDYQGDLFVNIIAKIEELSGKKYGDSEDTTKAIRIVADHLRAATFIMGDEKGVAPSNTGQGYIVRRLIRRAVRYGKQLGIENELWTKDVAQVVINDYTEAYSELEKNSDFIIKNLTEEEEKFGKTLEKGLKELEKIGPKVSGKDAFILFSTYGFPVEMVKEIAEEVDMEGFNEEMKKHQELSRTASAGMFKGGLADASEQTIKYHTACHLLLAALKQVLGNQVSQKGSNITEERLRFDFSHDNKLTDEQKEEVERLVNEKIKEDLPVTCEEMPYEKAKEEGATGAFEDKYGEVVKVYSIGPSMDSTSSPQTGSGEPSFSKELCGGPHAERTGGLGHFRIVKEKASSAGVRRIKAVLD